LHELVAFQQGRDRDPEDGPEADSRSPHHQSLEEEYPPDAVPRGAQRLEDPDLAHFLGGDQQKVRHDGESGHQRDQGEDDEHHRLFQFQRREKVLVHVEPRPHQGHGAHLLLDGDGHSRGLVRMLDPDPHPAVIVFQLEHLLGGRDGCDRQRRIVIVESGLDQPGHAEHVQFRKARHRIGVRRRTQHEQVVAGRRPEGSGQFFPQEHRGRPVRDRSGKVAPLTVDHPLVQSGDRPFPERVDALDDGAGGGRAFLDERLSHHERGPRFNLGDGPERFRPVAGGHGSLRRQRQQMRLSPQDLAADVFLKTGHDGQCDDEGGHPQGDSADGDDGGQPSAQALSSGCQVAEGQEPLERTGHVLDGSAPERRSGNRITSRMDSVPDNSMVSRSMPTPNPPAGGIPYSKAITNSSSQGMASLSPSCRLRTWSWKACRWTSGSFCSE